VKTWFTADTHFGHGGAMGRFKRPFSSAREMDAFLVEVWNQTIAPEDEVWHLGDFAFRVASERVATLLSVLNGRKRLITGNNDGPATLEALGWLTIGDYAEIEIEGARVVLCHYPFRTWNGMYKGAYNLHGHSHGQLAQMRRQVDVGVDVWAFKPIDLATIRRKCADPTRRPR
jgi:calcineurin-like phosphoesterase family protein